VTVIIFRYDDYHADRGAKDASKSRIEYRLLDIFSRHQVPITMGVVPNVSEDYEVASSRHYFPLSDDRKKFVALQDAVACGVVEPALHGYQHETVTQNGRKSEFMGLQFDAQLRKIQQGQRALETWLNVPIASFIPPWNTYDEQTVRALEAVNIPALSASLGTACQGEATALVHLPRTCALSEFDEALAEVRGVGNGRRAVPSGVKFIVMMFHHFSFFDSDDALARQYANVSLEQLESIVERCAHDENIQALSIGEAAHRYKEQLQDGRFAAAVQYDDCRLRLGHKRLIGAPLARRYPHRAFYPIAFYQKRLPWLKRLAGRKV
jgi:hypothetical protein